MKRSRVRPVAAVAIVLAAISVVLMASAAGAQERVAPATPTTQSAAPRGDTGPGAAGEPEAVTSDTIAAERATDASNSTSPDAEAARAAIEMLEDEAGRERLLQTLRAIARVTEEPTPEEGLVAQPVSWLHDEIERRAADVEATIRAIAGAPNQFAYFLDWLSRQVRHDSSRAFWLRSLTQIGIVIGVGLAVGLGLYRGLASARAPFICYAPPTPLHFAIAVIAHAIVRCVPILAATAAAALTAWSLDLRGNTGAVTRSLVEGLAFVTALGALLRAFLNVDNPHMRVFHLDQPTGRRLQHSIIVILWIAGYGYFGLQAARALGLPWTLHAFFEHLLFVAACVLFIRLILRFRGHGADGLRALGDETHLGVVGRFLPWSRLARVWHVAAILAGLTLYASWALGVAGGPVFLARAVGGTLLVLFVVRLIDVWLTERTQDSAPSSEDGEDAEDTRPIVAAPLTVAFRLGVTVVAGVLILQAWSVDVVGWLASEDGESVRTALATSAIAFGLAYAVWKLVSSVMMSAAEETDRLGRLVRSSRSRTLLAIGRNVAFVVIWTLTGMLVLSELGVNLAPLLAGAGVIGLAGGFGSQQLVRDIITGFFILLEDTISVGDVADLGGKVGVVEAITMRTVQLRGYDGQMHTIPFSTITTVSNLTKDFSYYVFDIRVARDEDVDRAMAVMAEVGDALRHDVGFRRLILEPLEVAGVDAFQESAVVIKARIKTRPLQQWTVGREYNRRLKKRFDALGIAMPFPQRTLHVAAPFGLDAETTPTASRFAPPDAANETRSAGA